MPASSARSVRSKAARLAAGTPGSDVTVKRAVVGGNADPIADALLFVHQVTGDEDRRATHVDVFHEGREHFASNDWIEAVGGFVEHEELCLLREREQHHQLP